MNIEKLLKKIFKYREIYRSDNKQYLTRYYIFRKPRKWLPSLYLHCFHSSDFDPELHNHPWKRSLSLILSGAYKEEYRDENYNVKVRVLKAGDINYITDDKYHRIDLITPKVWTLFLSGSKNDNTWYFWNRNNSKVTHWRNFEDEKKLQNIEMWRDCWICKGTYNKYCSRCQPPVHLVKNDKAS